MLRALIFDFDGLILDTETPIIDAYEAVHQGHAKPFDRAVFTRNIGHADFLFDPWAAFGKGADLNSLEGERREVRNALMVKQPILPGVQDLLGAASAAGLRLGVASNSGHDWVEGHLHRLGLHHHFSWFSCRGDTPSPKPEPDIYRHALNGLGVLPSQAVAFEDSAIGVLAAARAGLRVVAVPNASTDGHVFEGASLVLPSLLGLTLERIATLSPR